MRPDRKLQLRRETLADLSSDELATIGAGSPEAATHGRVCVGAAIATVIILIGSAVTTISRQAEEA